MRRNITSSDLRQLICEHAERRRQSCPTVWVLFRETVIMKSRFQSLCGRMCGFADAVRSCFPMRVVRRTLNELRHMVKLIRKIGV